MAYKTFKTPAIIDVIRILALMILILPLTDSQAQLKKETVDFEFEGDILNGILNTPDGRKPKGIVLIVHGSGRTNAIAGEWYLDVREAILKSGYATYMWDKKGCGKSSGTFNYNQPVQNSASEVIAAIHTLKQMKVQGSDAIGLWGISRAGWINPFVISQYKDIKFWISVSGVDDKENFRYLLEQNLRISGQSEEMVALIAGEWLEGSKITHAGGTFETYQAATSNLRKNEFWLKFTNGGIPEEEYYAYQQTFREETLDEETGLQLYVKDFGAMLSNIKCPVLALFGEKDMNVDWTKTRDLYKKTLPDVTIRSFPDCNHNLFLCKTGGFYETENSNLPRERCSGFLDAITGWLNRREQGSRQ